MSTLLLLLISSLAAQVPSPDGDHARNPVYRTLRAEGISANGVAARLPDPVLADGAGAEGGLAAIRAVVGDDRAVRELLKDSITAPFVLKARDVKAGDATIRVADLYFSVHATLDEVDLEHSLAQADKADVEAGNMRFGAKTLGPDDLARSKPEQLPKADGITGWYSHATGRLLDRIAVEATDRVVATRTPESLVVAARTDHSFDDDPRHPNQWSPLVRKGKEETPGPRRIYQGGGSYVKLTRLAAEPGTLFVEAHLAFVEPQAWFQGNPILRSKIGLIAQDQVRQIRREIEKKRAKK